MSDITLDIREMHPRERHPRIHSVWETLPVGATLTLVNDHNPKPLLYEFHAERTGEFEWKPVEEGPEKWVVAIRRVAAASGAGVAGERPVAPPWAGRTPDVELDVRPDIRAGGEPLGRIREAAQRLTAGQVLSLRAPFEPKPLYAVLRNMGFEHWSQPEESGDWQVLFRKRAS
ncbi:MAG: DUF2249 domain-containing protein [Elusimicrobia bacterium]|nr:DUF2249 domain-containing protein [Elusimicrobiota bacterium]